LIEEIHNIGKYRCRVLYSRGTGIPIVFLHGYMFTSDIWIDIGLLGFLEEKDVPYLAIDMPYGARSNCNPKTRDPDENVFVVREAVHGLFGRTKPLIVGASLGGYIALKYSIDNPVSGLFLIAPVHGLDKELVNKYQFIDAPVMIIWGSRDDIVSRGELEELAKILEARLIVYENAKHPAYLDQPDKFKKDLYAFYEALLLK